MAGSPRRWPWRLKAPRRLTFTRDGKMIVGLSIAIGLAAVNTGNNLLYLMLGWILSFIIASGILSERSLRQLIVTRRAPARIYAGQPFMMEISVDNPNPKRASYAIEVEDLIGDKPLDKRCFFLKIPPGKRQQASYRHTFLRRGRYQFSGVRVATRFPFGLFRKSKDNPLADEVLVYPALTSIARPPPRTDSRGAAVANRVGRRGEFFGLREHRLGDDRRDVHWRSSARTGRMLVREYEDERAREVTILLDNALPGPTRDALENGRTDPDALAAADALERAVSQTASLAVAYLSSGWAVALITRGQKIPSSMGRSHEGRILRALALVTPVSDDTPFSSSASPRIESVLVIPAGIEVHGRPQTASVVEA